jgi:hypothetical protein
VLGRRAESSFINGELKPSLVIYGKVAANVRNHRMTPTLIANVAEIIQYTFLS